MTDSGPRPPSQADILRLEQSLRAAVPEAVFASPRVVRRIIRADLDLPFLRARVPHRESIALPPARLLELADDVWALPAELPETILLVARPDPENPALRGHRGLATAYWRALAHGCFDIAACDLLAEEATDGSDFRQLVERAGETAFAEATAVLAQEGVLRDPGDRREAMAEWIAVVLELAAFEPRLLPVWFPAVEDHESLVDLFETLIDGEAILDRTRPAELDDPAAADVAAAEEADLRSGARPAGRLTRRAAAFLQRRTLAAARRGNDVRGAILQWRLRHLARGDEAARERADRRLDRRIARLVRRLERALGPAAAGPADLTAVIATLVEQSGGSAWTQAARLLYDLQKICVDSERESYRTQLLSWAFTLGRMPLIRPLPLQRVALVHRHAAAAFRRLPAVPLPGRLAETAAGWLSRVLESTEMSVRSRLQPPVRASLVEAGLEPDTLVEEAAFDKLVDELLDSVVDRGFESFANLRDAVSRSQVKLPDLASLHELIEGDPLLRADRNLAGSLDGSYRKAPAYLLAMQRLSALAFGVPLGRALTLHLLLPFGGAWVLWKGLEHIVEPVSRYSLGEPVHIYSRTAVIATGAIIWLLMHVAAVRAAASEAVRAAGGLAQLIFITLPGRLLRLPAVEQFLRSRPVRLFRRYLWSPLVLTVGVWLLLPHGGRASDGPPAGNWLSRGNPWLPTGLFLASAATLNSPLGRSLEERLLETVGRALQQLHARLIVGLVAWVVDTFRAAVDFIEGMLYAVDEQLRFRSDESRLALAVKAVLTTLWSVVDWLVRFCVTLLIEPQLNPIKHFPVVTVSHKLLVPMIPVVAGNLAAATGMERGLALTTVTFVSTALPGVFGFLAWELKENWRLYAANRPPTLRPVQVGRHGESMRRLLLPGFHSGTIPKLFGKWRRDVDRQGDTISRSRAEEHLAELSHDIAAFVDDECLGLLRRSRLLADLPLEVGEVRLATNRVTIALVSETLPGGPLEIELGQQGGTLISRLATSGWLDGLREDRRRLVRLALAGLDCLCGVDFTTVLAAGRTESLPVEPIAWVDWQATWERERTAGAGPAQLAQRHS
jgi:hypothetical protein